MNRRNFLKGLMAAPAATVIGCDSTAKPLDLELPEDFDISRPHIPICCHIRVLSGEKFRVKVIDPDKPLDEQIRFETVYHSTPGWKLFPNREGSGPIQQYPKMWNTVTPDQKFVAPAAMGNRVIVEFEHASKQYGSKQVFILSEKSPNLRWMTTYMDTNVEFFELTVT